MKNKFIHADLVKLIGIFLILAISIMWVTYHGLAQDLPPQQEDNSPGQITPSEQETPFISGPNENDNHGATAGSAPDMVITDPNTDLLALIKNTSQINSVYSSVIPAAEFTPDWDQRDWFFGFGTAYIYPTSANNYCGVAPLYLPSGSTVTAFASYLWDDDPDYISVYLYAKPLGSTTSSITMADFTSEGQFPMIQLYVDNTINQPVIDNNNYTYYIGVCLWAVNNNHRFYASQVFYSR
jgi:hypothetical protein